MAETLYIRLGSRYQDKIHWLMLSSDQQEIIGSGELANAELLADLTEKAVNRKVTVFVPASDVAFKSLNVPSKSARAMKQAVPYMLEEELAQDVEQLFFAYANVKSDSEYNCHVAAVENQQMTQWLSWLSDAGIKTAKMIPDALALPLFDDKQTLVALDEQVLIKKSPWQAMTFDENVWQLLINQQEEPISIAHYSPLVLDNEAVTLAAQPEDLPLFLFAKHSHDCVLNLLQGEFSQKQKASQTWVQWRLAACIAVLACLISFSGVITDLYRLDKQQVALEEQIHTIFQQSFATKKGKAVNINKVRPLVKAKIKALNYTGSEEKFFPLINKIIPSFIAVKNLKPETLKYDHKRNEVRIQASAKSYQDFERFKSELEKMKLEVSQGSQNNQGNLVTGSFSIKDAS